MSSGGGILVVLATLIIVFIVLDAGCVASNQINTTKIKTTTFVSISTPIPLILDSHSGYWIKVNPRNDHHYRREIIEINGTTNLGTDQILHYSVDRNTYYMLHSCPMGGDCYPMKIDGAENISSGVIPIMSGRFNGNSWSFLLNASGPGYETDNGINGPSFIVNVTSQDKTVQNATMFWVSN